MSDILFHGLQIITKEGVVVANIFKPTKETPYFACGCSYAFTADNLRKIANELEDKKPDNSEQIKKIEALHEYSLFEGLGNHNKYVRKDEVLKALGDK